MEVAFVAGPADEGVLLGKFLRRNGASLALIRGLKRLERGILCNGQPAHTNVRLAAGDRVALTMPPEREFSARPENIPLCTVYESRHALVLDKPAGMVAHPVFSHKAGTLANAFCGLMELRGAVGATFRPIGRLDADTSGLALCAMNPYAAPLLSRTMEKIYLALAQGCFEEAAGSIDTPLAAAPGSTVRQRAGEGGRPSMSSYRVLAQGRSAALVAVRPRTGRTHQIRGHVASIGHPLLGDWLYNAPCDEEGSKETAAIGRHALHCALLRFREPQAEMVSLASTLPEDMLLAMRRCGIAQPPLVPSMLWDEV